MTYKRYRIPTNAFGYEAIAISSSSVVIESDQPRSGDRKNDIYIDDNGIALMVVDYKELVNFKKVSTWNVNHQHKIESGNSFKVPYNNWVQALTVSSDLLIIYLVGGIKIRLRRVAGDKFIDIVDQNATVLFTDVMEAEATDQLVEELYQWTYSNPNPPKSTLQKTNADKFTEDFLEEINDYLKDVKTQCDSMTVIQTKTKDDLREEAKTELDNLLKENETLLKSKSHPNKYFAKQGKTLYDYYIFSTQSCSSAFSILKWRDKLLVELTTLKGAY